MPQAKADRERVLDKLKKMYAHSKSAEAIGSEEEARSFAAKIQELLSQHKIELSEIEYQKLDEVDPVQQRLVDFESAGIQIKRSRVAWHEQLGSVVCRAYFCKMVVITGSSRLYFAGRGTDLEAAEQVFLYLVRVASKLSDRAYVEYFYECRAAGDVTKARGFRSAYLDGFTERLGERYREERERQKREWASAGTALIRLTDALKAVDSFLATRTQKVRGVSGRAVDHAEGYERGRKAADALPIGQDVKQVES